MLAKCLRTFPDSWVVVSKIYIKCLKSFTFSPQPIQFYPQCICIADTLCPHKEHLFLLLFFLRCLHSAPETVCILLCATDPYASKLLNIWSESSNLLFSTALRSRTTLRVSLKRKKWGRMHVNILPAGQSSRAPSRSVECFSCSPPTVQFIETTE